MTVVVEALMFIETNVISLLFALIFGTIVVMVVKMNRQNGEYGKFMIAHLIMKNDGTLDRKAFRETLLFFVSMYGFIHVMHKFPDQIINYFWVMAVIWLGAHVAADKIPNFGVPSHKPEEAKHE